MSSISRFAWLSAAIFACLFTSAQAQDAAFPFMRPGEFSPEGVQTPYTTPFDSDLQFFTPFEDSGFGSPQLEPDGWFFRYNRLYWNVSAPEQSQKADGDFGWGNHYDLGFTGLDGGTWKCDLIDMSGPNLPTNSSEMSGFAFDRSWTMPMANGTFLTPNFAIRYVNIIDRTLMITNPDFGLNSTGGIAPPTKNNIIGGQAGLGWHMRRGPWRVATNAQLYVAENFQVFTSRRVNQSNRVVEGSGTSRREFVPAGQLSLDMSYSLTRDIAFDIGWDMLYFGRGIARQGQIEFNDENMMYTGCGVGISFNR